MHIVIPCTRKVFSHKVILCAHRRSKKSVLYLPADHYCWLLETGRVSSSPRSVKFSLGWAGVRWVKLLPRKESLFNKSQNQWPATACYRILSEKCVVLLSASRHRARDVSLSCTLDFVSAAATSPPPALPGIKLRLSSARSAARWFIALAGPGPSVRNTVSVWSLNLILRVLLVTLEVCLCKD